MKVRERDRSGVQLLSLRCWKRSDRHDLKRPGSDRKGDELAEKRDECSREFTSVAVVKLRFPRENGPAGQHGALGVRNAQL